VETGRMVVGLEIDETTELNINDNIYL
jgi:hypothetical protein